MKSKESKRQKTSHNDDTISKIKQPLTAEIFLTGVSEAGNDNTINISNLINNEYQGCSNSNKKSNNVINTKSFPHLTKPISKKEFYDIYVSKRKPCIMDFHPSQINSKKDKMITKAILKEISGNEVSSFMNYR